MPARGETLLAQLAALPDLDSGVFAGWRAFIAALRSGTLTANAVAVKAQLAGPLTCAVAAVRSGVPTGAARDQARRLVVAGAHAMTEALQGAVVATPVVIFVDEPALVLWARPDPPWPLAGAVDDLSFVAGALGDAGAVAGIHVCGDGDARAAFDADFSIVQLSVANAVRDPARLLRHSSAGRVVAWGAVPAAPGGPRPTRAGLIKTIGRALEATGDAAMVAAHSMVTPECGMPALAPATAKRRLELAAQVAAHVAGHGQ